MYIQRLCRDPAISVEARDYRSGLKYIDPAREKLFPKKTTSSHPRDRDNSSDVVRIQESWSWISLNMHDIDQGIYDHATIKIEASLTRNNEREASDSNIHINRRWQQQTTIDVSITAICYSSSKSAWFEWLKCVYEWQKTIYFSLDLHAEYKACWKETWHFNICQ